MNFPRKGAKNHKRPWQKRPNSLARFTIFKSVFPGRASPGSWAGPSEGQRVKLRERECVGESYQRGCMSFVECK